ncbi:hypothetical protein A0H76_841 [Hepatospora eriocheir]|uniref:Uncharacterized protein n=1 Tax=Hepatospora eriocheir TaxID=1081669 RepID=A0A1X0QI39_9MICR|nr:hypothetical protein A0H76_841 [Hepatospora eriocheir]
MRYDYYDPKDLLKIIFYFQNKKLLKKFINDNGVMLLMIDYFKENDTMNEFNRICIKSLIKLGI